MFERNRVFNLMRKGNITLVNQAIFTFIFCPVYHQTTHSNGDIHLTHLISS